MGYKHTHEEILSGALETAYAEGLSQLSYGRVARRLGISDRTVVYYFPTVSDLAGAILLALGDQLRSALGAAVSQAVPDHRALLREAWPVLADPGTDRVFALYFEASGLAAAGRAPYADLVPPLLAAWVDWAAGLLEGEAADRRAEAETAVAVIDGLLLVRLLASPEAAERAAQRLAAEPGNR